MKLTKFKVLAASAVLSLSLLGGCYAKLEITRKPHYNESIRKDETIEKYKNLMEKAIKYDNLVPGKDYAEERIMIGFDDGTTKEEANKLIESYDENSELEMLSYFSEIECAVVKVPQGKEQAYALFFQNMSDETIVKYAELDYVARILQSDNKKYTECLEKHKDLVPGKDYVEGSIIVGFDKGVTKEEARQFIENYGKNNELKMIHHYDFINGGTVKVPEGKEIDYACQLNSIKDTTIIDYAKLNIILHTEV